MAIERDDAIQVLDKRGSESEHRRKQEALKLVTEQAKPAAELLQHDAWDAYVALLATEIDKAQKNLDAIHADFDSMTPRTVDDMIAMRVQAVAHKTAIEALTWAMQQPKQLVEQQAKLADALKGV